MQTETCEKNTFSLRRFLTEAGVYVGVFLLTLVLFLFLKPYVYPEEYYIRMGVVAQGVMIVALLACLLVGAYLFLHKKLTAKRIVILLLIIGFALRVGYMLYTPAATRQQDTYSGNFDGHEAYAWTIFSTGKLPTNNNYQFYHPPLNAAIQAFFMRFMQGLTKGLSKVFGLGEYFPSAFTFAKPTYITDDMRYFLYQSCQILSVLYSFIACVVSVKIIDMFDLPTKTKVLISAFVILYPRNMQFSGMLNNDGISFMFGIVALYFALKWWKGGKSLVDILLCALAVGLGMSAKLSSATVCLPIAGIFVWEFFASIKREGDALSIGKTIMQYGLFLLVCAPIGLWFQVYAGVRFDQPFGFVFSNLNHKLYTGDHSLFERFIFAFDINEYIGSLYCRPFEGNYNLFNYALRSSIFGEFSYWQGEGLAVGAILLAYMGAAFLFIALIFAFVEGYKRRKEKPVLLGEMQGRTEIISRKDFLFVFLLMQSQVLSEIYFYLKMPYGCTMDFRYIMPMILAMALALGYAQKALDNSLSRAAKPLNTLLTITVTAFLIVSSLFYCVCI